MRSTVEEIREAYLEELRQYKAWTDDRKAVYGEDSSPLSDWGGSDFGRVTAWNGTLLRIEAILGLTQEEVDAACIEVGMIVKKDESEEV